MIGNGAEFRRDSPECLTAANTLPVAVTSGEAAADSRDDLAVMVSNASQFSRQTLPRQLISAIWPCRFKLGVATVLLPPSERCLRGGNSRIGHENRIWPSRHGESYSSAG